MARGAAREWLASAIGHTPLALELLTKTGRVRTGAGRPAALYTAAAAPPQRLRLPLARPEPA